MREITTIIEKQEYGEIIFKLEETLTKLGVSKTRLSKSANLHYSVVKRLCDGNLVQLDLNVIKKVCYVLECDISDIVEYIPFDE